MHSPHIYCHDPDPSLKVLATGPQQSAGETSPRPQLRSNNAWLVIKAKGHM